MAENVLRADGIQKGDLKKRSSNWKEMMMAEEEFDHMRLMITTHGPRGSSDPRILLTAGRVDLERYREEITRDPTEAEMMHVAFLDACIDLEAVAWESGIKFGEDVSVPGAGGNGFLQVVRRLSYEDGQVAREMENYLEQRFDKLLEKHFELNKRRPAPSIRPPTPSI